MPERVILARNKCGIGEQTLQTIKSVMGLPEAVQSRANLSYHRPAAALFAAVLAVLAGCVTKSDTVTKSVSYSGPGFNEDLAEYRQIASEAQKLVQATLASLDRTVAQTPCPPRVFKGFNKDVQRLEVDSFKIRARAQAIRARGDAYFQQWHEQLRSVKDPVARQLAEQSHDPLQERFAQISIDSQQTREAFQPFMAGLRRLRNGLENAPGIAGTDSMKELIRKTRDNGQKVQAGLAAMLGELDSVAAILKPEKTARKD